MLHAEVLALQDRLGISYKDAAHRLFMAEVEQVKKADSAAKAFRNVLERMDAHLAFEILEPLNSIDKGEVGEYERKEGRWDTRSRLDSRRTT